MLYIKEYCGRRSSLSVIVSLIFLMGALPALLNAQQSANTARKNIVGSVIFEEEEEPVEYATVQLLKAKDSTVVVSSATDKNGEFELSKIAPDNYILKTSYISFKTQFYNLKKESFNEKQVSIPQIKLKEESILLSEAVVVGKMPDMVIKEDTIEYNPAAYNLHSSSLVEDLLKRLPGVEVDMDGKITVAGKEVRRVMVDGENFFGRDPKMTTQNLEIDIIEKLQVIEKKSDLEELTGIDDGKRETIINITIKEDKKRGWINNIQAGLGNLTQDISSENIRYESRSMFNRFIKDNKYSIVLNASNNSERGQGVNSNRSIGMNMINVFSEKFKITGDVSYDGGDSFVKRKSFRQNILVDSVSYRSNESESKSEDHRVSLNYRFEYKPNEQTTILFSPSLSLSKSHSNDTSYTATMAGDIDRTEVNNSRSKGHRDSDGMSLGGNMIVSHKFAKKGRVATLSLNGDMNNNDQLGYNKSVSEFLLLPDRNQNLNQESKTTTKSGGYSVNASYVEPIFSKTYLQMAYTLRSNSSDNLRNTYEYDYEVGDYTILNPEYSKSLINNYINQTISLSLRGVSDKYQYNAGIKLEPSYIKSKSYIKDGISAGVDSIVYNPDGRSVVNYSPDGEFTYRFSKDKNLRLNYRGNSREPSIDQLDPTEDLTNPLNIRSGNPDLLPSFTNNVSMMYNFSNRESQKSLRASVSYGFVINQIINKTMYESNTGIQKTFPVNQNGIWNSSANILYNTPISKKKDFQFSTNTDLSLRNQIGYMSFREDAETKNTAKTISVSENMTLSYRRDWLYLQTRGIIRYSTTRNSLEDRKNQEDISYRAGLNASANLPKDWVFESSLQYSGQSGLSTGYNRDETIWDINVNKRFMKNKQATVSLKWTDLLQQRMSIRRNVTSNFIEDSESNVMTGYFLVSFSYRFNNFGGRSGGRGEGRPGGGERMRRSDFGGGGFGGGGRGRM